VATEEKDGQRTTPGRQIWRRRCGQQDASSSGGIWRRQHRTELDEEWSSSSSSSHHISNFFINSCQAQPRTRSGSTHKIQLKIKLKKPLKSLCRKTFDVRQRTASRKIMTLD